VFSGIVEDVGRIVSTTELPGGRRFRIRSCIPTEALKEGASVAVDGACLTVVSFGQAPRPGDLSQPADGEAAGRTEEPAGGRVGEGGDGPRADFEVEAIGTTLARTVAAGYVEGTKVNLERSRTLGDRLEGHLVQGHVDGIATLEDVREEGIHHLLDLALPPEVWRGTILHGSITLNGVSLTVNDLEDPNRCQVAIIPYTWTHTNLSALAPGDEVNVEGDVIGKYVTRYLDSLRSDDSNLLGDGG